MGKIKNPLCVCGNHISVYTYYTFFNNIAPRAHKLKVQKFIYQQALILGFVKAILAYSNQKENCSVQRQIVYKTMSTVHVRKAVERKTESFCKSLQSWKSEEVQLPSETMKSN